MATCLYNIQEGLLFHVAQVWHFYWQQAHGQTICGNKRENGMDSTARYRRTQRMAHNPKLCIVYQNLCQCVKRRCCESLELRSSLALVLLCCFIFFVTHKPDILFLFDLESTVVLKVAAELLGCSYFEWNWKNLSKQGKIGVLPKGLAQGSTSSQAIRHLANCMFLVVQCSLLMPFKHLASDQCTKALPRKLARVLLWKSLQVAFGLLVLHGDVLEKTWLATSSMHWVGYPKSSA